MRTLSQLREKLDALGPEGRALLGDLDKVEFELETRGRRLAAMTTAHRLARTLSVAVDHDPGYALEAILMAVQALSGAERSFVLRADPLSPTLFTSLGSWPGVEGAGFQADLVQDVLQRGRSGFIGDSAERDPRGLIVVSFRSAMAVPVWGGGGDPACLYVDGPVHQGAFDRVDLETLYAFVTGIQPLLSPCLRELQNGVVP